MGRYRPWMLGTSIVYIPLVVMLFWAHPDWGVTARTAWGCGFYFLAVVAATSWNIPFCALNGVITPYPGERASFASYRIGISSLACAIPTAIFLPLVAKYSNNYANAPRGFVLATITVCMIAVPFIFLCIGGTKEAIKPPKAQKIHSQADVRDGRKEYATPYYLRRILCIRPSCLRKNFCSNVLFQ